MLHQTMCALAGHAALRPHLSRCRTCRSSATCEQEQDILHQGYLQHAICLHTAILHHPTCRVNLCLRQYFCQWLRTREG